MTVVCWTLCKRAILTLPRFTRDGLRWFVGQQAADVNEQVRLQRVELVGRGDGHVEALDVGHADVEDAEVGGQAEAVTVQQPGVEFDLAAMMDADPTGQAAGGLVVVEDARLWVIAVDAACDEGGDLGIVDEGNQPPLHMAVAHAFQRMVKDNAAQPRPVRSRRLQSRFGAQTIPALARTADKAGDAQHGIAGLV